MWSPRQVTHLPPVWNILLPLAQTPDRRDQRLLLYHPKDRDAPREAYTSPFKVTSPHLPAGPSSQRFGAPKRDEAVLALDPLERRLAGSSSFETAQLHSRSTQRPGPRLASKAVDNPQPPSHGCRPVQLVHAEVGPQ